MDSRGEVASQFDSWGKSSFRLAALIVSHGSDADWIVLEDVPFGINSQAQIKPVLRLQGVLIHALGAAGLLEKTIFLGPSYWQRTFEGVWRGGKDGAEAAARQRGYDLAPDMLTLHADDIPPIGDKRRAKVRADLRKATTDYYDAYLIARWGLANARLGPLTAAAGAQPAFI